jgi:Holliday junction resolvase RusA-like endonuclease
VTETLVLDVFGLPASQGNKTGYVVPGKDGAKPRAVLVEGKGKTGRKRIREWRADVREAAAGALAARVVAGLPDTIDEPISVSVTFYFPAVSSDPYRTRHSTKPDIEKVLRATFDPLVQSGLIADDARICSVTATKRYAIDRSPGARIEITLLGESEARDREVRKVRAKEARARG